MDEPSAEREQLSTPRAISVERFKPDTMTVMTPDPGPDGTVPFLELHMMAAPLPQAPNLFTFCKAFELTPEIAVRLGEHLAAEGRKAMSGLTVAHTMPAGLKAA